MAAASGPGRRLAPLLLVTALVGFGGCSPSPAREEPTGTVTPPSKDGPQIAKPTDGGTGSPQGSDAAAGPTGQDAGGTAPDAGGASASDASGAGQDGGSLPRDATTSGPDAAASSGADTGSPSGAAPAGAAAALGVGYYHLCILAPDGVPKCAGRDTSGGGSRLMPPAGLKAREIVATHTYSCVIDPPMTSPPVRCWGAFRAGVNMPPTDVSPVQIVVGDNHACVLNADKSVRCWGGAKSAAPAGLRAKRLAACGGGTCAIKDDDGTVVCWGSNPPPIPAGTMAIDVAVGSEAINTSSEVESGNITRHGCVIGPDGAVACWGDGDGAKAPAGLTAVEVTAGDGGSCARLASGEVRCWGSIPSPASSLRVTSVRAANKTACGVDKDGALACWGTNTDDKAFSLVGMKVLAP